MTSDQYISLALEAGCPPDQIENLLRAGITLQFRQLSASAAARLCDRPDGPTAIGYGGARGGGKSHWLLAQMGADDCQRVPGLKCLLLRRSARANLENFSDLRQRVLRGLPHKYTASNGQLIFPNGSRIIAGHYQHEKEIENYLGLEYDLIGIEEATTLTSSKHQNIRTCARTSKPHWRPRMYYTTNPGGVGHVWFHTMFVLPFERKAETTTRFIPATIQDNPFTNPEYIDVLSTCTGWQRQAWLDGNWNIAAGQFFKNFRSDVHVLDDFRMLNGLEWFAAMDYGYTHYTIILIACLTEAGHTIVIDELALRGAIPQVIIQSFCEMLTRHRFFLPRTDIPLDRALAFRKYSTRYISRLIAGHDLFSTHYDGSNIAAQFKKLGLSVVQANTNRVEGWAKLLAAFGDPARGIQPTLFIHKRCNHLLNTLPYLQHDPDHPADILKVNTNEEGFGGDDAADALRYLVATPVRTIHVGKLRGL